MTDHLGLSKLLHALGHRVKVSPARPERERVRLSTDDFDLMWRATIQLGRYFKADMAVEYGSISFDLHNETVDELCAALDGLDQDVIDLIGFLEDE